MGRLGASKKYVIAKTRTHTPPRTPSEKCRMTDEMEAFQCDIENKKGRVDWICRTFFGDLWCARRQRRPFAADGPSASSPSALPMVLPRRSTRRKPHPTALSTVDNTNTIIKKEEGNYQEVQEKRRTSPFVSIHTASDARTRSQIMHSVRLTKPCMWGKGKLQV